MASEGNKEETPTGSVEEAAAAPSARWMGREADASDGEAEVGEDPLGCPTVGDLMGSHRLSAAVSRLEREIQSLQAELEEVESRLRPSSAACEEVVSAVECTPDGLLPATPGPEGVAWDRWFQRVQGSKREGSRSSGAGGRGAGGGRRWWTQGRRFLPSSSGQVHVETVSE